MNLDMCLKDEDREIEYHVTVKARVVEEIGGKPGYCVDIEWLFIESIVVWFNKCGLETVMDSQFRRHIQQYVQERFDEEIRDRCVERYRDMKLAS